MKIDIKKIIIFDSWTLGSRHIFRLTSLLANSGIKLCYCHVGSWGDDIGKKKEEVIIRLNQIFTILKVYLTLMRLDRILEIFA